MAGRTLAPWAAGPVSNGHVPGVSALHSSGFRAELRPVSWCLAKSVNGFNFLLPRTIRSISLDTHL